ncbi:MAG: hypothetical protein HPY44_07125 [Armatimonadetes bacterium]|nr:hypothetical protein [Armatimonadota bacterium]
MRTSLSRRVSRLPILLSCGLPAALILVAIAPVFAQSPHLRVQNVVRQFVETTGYEVIGLGSWIDGSSYNPATSDHDLRLVLPKGAGAPDRKWLEARQKLTELIKAEFGDDAASVLSRTNLYPPSQLMGAVDDIDDAAWVFTRNGAVPNLGHTGPITRNTPIKELSEGLYGEGSRAFTQYYEKAKGRLFYKAPNGRCITGMTDLTHMSEGVRTFTTAGTADTALQWVEHAIEECAHGRGDKVAKYLERIERDLLKSRDLARLPTSNALREQLKSVRELLKANPARLADLGDDVARLLSQAATEASILKSYAKAGPMGRMYQRIMLDGVEAGNELGRLLRTAQSKVSGAVSMDQLVTAFTVYMAVKGTAQAAGEGGVGEAIRAAGPLAVSLASLPVSLLMDMTNAIMKEAEAAGYEMAAASQEPWDLMAGVYTALGRDSDEDDPRRRFTLDDLVRGWHVEARLSSLVFGQCLRASRRNMGGVTENVDMSVANAMYGRCWPVIRDAWRWQRDMLVSEYVELAADALHTPMLLSYEPCPAKYEGRPVQVTVKARSRDRKLGAKLTRMEEILKILCGKRAVLAEDWIWQPEGVMEDMTTTDIQRRYTFDKPGVHPVVLTVRFEAVSPDIQPPEPHRVLLRRELKAVVDVLVDGDLEQPAVRGYVADARPGWVRVTSDSPPPNANWAQRLRSYLNTPVRDHLGNEHRPYALELVREGEARSGSGRYNTKTYAFVCVSPQEWQVQMGFGPQDSRPMDLAKTQGNRLAQVLVAQLDLFGKITTNPGSSLSPPDTVEMVEPNKIAPYLRTMRVQYTSTAGEYWLNATAFVGVEVNPRDAAKYDVETLEATTRAAYEQAVREMEAIFSTARYVRE